MNSNDLIIKKLIQRRVNNPSVLASIIRKAIKNSKEKTYPSNSLLLKEYHELVKSKKLKSNEKIENLLRKRKIRSLSGIVTISVLTKPYPCPGNCLYCPTQKGVPKSYLDNEPAVLRAIANKYDPYNQVKSRLEALQEIGHPTDKIDLIIIGGTWSYLPRNYQNWFITRCFQACNQFKIDNNKNPKSKILISKEIQISKSKKTKPLREQRENEKAKNRIIGITIETRPDFINEKEIKWLRKLGVTRVELGVQSIYEDVLKFNNRNHGLKEIIEATHLLKDAGFKVCYHLMPNLPGSNLKRDLKMFKEIFSNPDFQPDMLKIYPCTVLKEAPLYKSWKEKKYSPYSETVLKNLLKEIKKKIPYYCRIQRLIRDIPATSIVAGSKITNLRQVIAEEMKSENWRCKCIRCREVKEKYNPKEKVYLFRQDYRASGGKEIFLSYENKNRTNLFSLLRLRIPSDSYRHFSHAIFSVLSDAAIIREIHTYGQMVPIEVKSKMLKATRKVQHKGLGKKLIKKAEQIAKKEFGFKKMAVISGIGVRDYYRKAGYRLKDTYMIKEI
jgi:elongator complex protein 3